MRVAVAVESAGGDSVVSPRFGRASGFLLFSVSQSDGQIVAETALPGADATSGSGAGVRTAQTIVNSGAEAVIAGSFGPNAAAVLAAAGAGMYLSGTQPAVTAVEHLRDGRLKQVSAATVPAHSGLRRGF